MNDQDALALETILIHEGLIILPPTNIPRPFFAPQYRGVANRGEAHLDTNIFLRAVRLANGQPVEGDTFRRAAAVLAFLSEIDFSCDPTMPLFELGMRQLHGEAVQDLESFRVADHVRPEVYTDIALGRLNAIPAQELQDAQLRAQSVQAEPRNSDFTAQLDTRDNAYFVGLVMFSLFQRADLTPMQRVQHLVTWMADEFIFMPACINWALHDFSSTVNRKSRILEKLTTTNPDATRKALRNAAHDMSAAKQWLDAVRYGQGDKVAVFCTADRPLQRIAGVLVSPPAEAAARTREFLEPLWGPDVAPQLEAFIAAEIARAQAVPNRSAIADARRAQVPARTAALEAKLGL